VAARKLPDPRAEITAFVLPPETRVGPQRASARLVQRIPGGGKRGIAGRTAELEGAVVDAELEALRLRLVTEARRLAAELGHVATARSLLADEIRTLGHYEELARARYASGRGLQADAVRIQTEITRLEAHRLELAERASKLRAELNELRRRPGAPVPVVTLRPADPGPFDWQALRAAAVASSPELHALEARAERSDSLAELAARGSSPDFSIGLTYAWVDPRDDVEVEDNGRDVLGINGGITIPVWGAAVDAEVEAATEERIAVEADRRAAVATIERRLDELSGRLPEIRRRLELLETVLPVQAEQSLESVEAAYVAGRADVLELLEAERVLLDARLATDRARTDLALVLIELEAAVAAPLARGGLS
jgi:outer membrane protein TolC